MARGCKRFEIGRFYGQLGGSYRCMFFVEECKDLEADKNGFICQRIAGWSFGFDDNGHFKKTRQELLHSFSIDKGKCSGIHVMFLVPGVDCWQDGGIRADEVVKNPSIESALFSAFILN